MTPKEKFYFRQRFRNRLFQAVVLTFAQACENDGMSMQELASRLGASPKDVGLMFSSPSKWTLDDYSDYMLALGHEIDPTSASLTHNTEG